MSRALARVTIIGFFTLLVVLGSSVIASATVAVAINVRPPADTPADAKLYIAGNHPSIGP